MIELIQVILATLLGGIGGYALGEMIVRLRRRRAIDRQVQELLDGFAEERNKGV